MKNKSEDLADCSPPAATLCLRVRYFETDQMQVVHHANYLVWFEAVRSEFCRKYGIDYSQMERDGLFLPILEVRCRYRRPARYDEELHVHVKVAERTRHTLKMIYRITRDEDLIAEGETTQMVVDREGKPRSFPTDVAERFDGG